MIYLCNFLLALEKYWIKSLRARNLQLLAMAKNVVIAISVLIFIANNAIAAIEPLDKVIAVVNDEVITQAELTREAEVLKNQLLHNKMPVPPEMELRKQVLRHLIDVHLQLQQAKRVGLTIEEAEIDEAMHSVAMQHKLTVPQLQEAVVAQGVSLKQYRKNLHKEITIVRVQQQMLGKQVQISDAEIQQVLKGAHAPKIEQEYHVQNILIPLSETPTPEEEKLAKEKAEAILVKVQRGADFSKVLDAEPGDLGWRKQADLPEIFAKEIDKMQKNQIIGPLRAANGYHLLKLVDIRRDATKYLLTSLHIRQILLVPIAGETDQDVKDRAGVLRRKVLAGENFSDLAQKHSRDFNSAPKGGDLGWMTPGKLPPALEAAANKLKTGEVSAPIKSSAGWHLVQVVGRRQQDGAKEFQQQQARQLLFQRKLNAEIGGWLQQLRHQSNIKIMDQRLS